MHHKCACLSQGSAIIYILVILYSPLPLLSYTISYHKNPATGEITDMFSFYHLPSTIMNHPLHKTLYVAYLFYTFHTATPFKDLLYDALVLAKKVSNFKPAG